MKDPIPPSPPRDAGTQAAKYGLIVAAISLAIVTVMVGIGPSLAVALGHLAGY